MYSMDWLEGKPKVYRKPRFLNFPSTSSKKWLYYSATFVFCISEARASEGLTPRYLAGSEIPPLQASQDAKQIRIDTIAAVNAGFFRLLKLFHTQVTCLLLSALCFDLLKQVANRHLQSSGYDMVWFTAITLTYYTIICIHMSRNHVHVVDIQSGPQNNPEMSRNKSCHFRWGDPCNKAAVRSWAFGTCSGWMGSLDELVLWSLAPPLLSVSMTLCSATYGHVWQRCLLIETW